MGATVSASRFALTVDGSSASVETSTTSSVSATPAIGEADGRARAAHLDRLAADQVDHVAASPSVSSKNTSSSEAWAS